MAKDILMIGNDIKLCNDIKNYFWSEMINLCYIQSIKEALWKIQFVKYCLIILSVPRLENNIHEMIVKIRKRDPVPILVILEDVSDSDKILSLENGADDVIDRTVVMGVLGAKIKALLRRYTELNHVVQNSDDIICYDRLVLDTGRKTVSIDETEISLPHKEYEILLYMLKNRWRTLTFQQIYETVWKDYYLNDKSIIFYHIGQLRRLIGDGWIENVHGIGYRLCDRKDKNDINLQTLEKP